MPSKPKKILVERRLYLDDGVDVEELLTLCLEFKTLDSMELYFDDGYYESDRPYLMFKGYRDETKEEKSKRLKADRERRAKIKAKEEEKARIIEEAERLELARLVEKYGVGDARELKGL